VDLDLVIMEVQQTHEAIKIPVYCRVRNLFVYSANSLFERNKRLLQRQWECALMNFIRHPYSRKFPIRV